jgi:hypothetical protein
MMKMLDGSVTAILPETSTAVSPIELRVDVPALNGRALSAAAAAYVEGAMGLFAPLGAQSLHELLRAHFPSLIGLAASIRDLIESDQLCVRVRRLPFNRLELPACRLFLLAFLMEVGQVSLTDAHRRQFIWDVTPRTETRWMTITETRSAAAFHTDASYAVSPDQYVAMFAVTPAADHGGETLLVPLDEVIHGSSLDAGDIEVLRHQLFPIRVPTVFTKAQMDDHPEWIFAPILADIPRVRFRSDLIAKGRACHPDIPARAIAALESFEASLRSLPPGRLFLEEGDLLLINNHHVLHARTEFRDMNRLLLRARLQPFSKGIGA